MISAFATIGLFLVVCICAEYVLYPTSGRGSSSPSTTGTTMRGGAGGEAQPAAHRVFTSSDMEVTR